MKNGKREHTGKYGTNWCEKKNEKKNDARLNKIKARRTTSRDACNKPKWNKNRFVKLKKI